MLATSPGPLLEPDWSTPPTWGVAWRTADTRAALSLLERPADEVTQRLSTAWARILEPSTPAAAAGLGNGALAAPVPGVPRCP